MRKTPGQNPYGFDHSSWNYRILQLRHALGWSQSKIARVMGIVVHTVSKLESGKTTRPTIDVIRRIRNLESAYADILKEYKKAPVRMDRLVNYRKDNQWSSKWRWGVKLTPIEVRRPEDIETMGEMESNSEPLFFGRGSRKRMQQTGVPLSRKAFLDRRRKAIIQGMRNKAAKIRNEQTDNNSE